MKEFDRFSFPRNYSGKVPLFFRKFPEKFRRKFPNSQPYLRLSCFRYQIEPEYQTELHRTFVTQSFWQYLYTCISNTHYRPTTHFYLCIQWQCPAAASCPWQQNSKWLLNWLLCTEYNQSALQRHDALKEIDRFYTRQEKTPKMFRISGGGLQPRQPPPAYARPWLKTPNPRGSIYAPVIVFAVPETLFVVRRPKEVANLAHFWEKSEQDVIIK